MAENEIRKIYSNLTNQILTSGYLDYNTINKHKASIKCDFLGNKIKYRLSTFLPLLENNENDERLKLYNQLMEIELQFYEYKNMKLENTPNVQQLLNEIDNMLYNYNFSKEKNVENLLLKSTSEESKIIKDLRIIFTKLEKLNIEIDEFVSSLKIHYLSFIELQLMSSNFIFHLYNKYVYFDKKYKEKTKNMFFVYDSFLYKQLYKTCNQDWIDFISQQFEKIGSNVMKNDINGFWLNAVFDSSSSNFISSSYLTINEFIKCNEDIESQSIIISVELFYPNLNIDIYTLLNNNQTASRIIIKFEQRSYFVANNVQPMFYIQDDEWNKDVNTSLTTLLNCIFFMKKVNAISIVFEEDCHVELNKFNSILIGNLLKKFSNSIEVFSLNRIRIPHFNEFYKVIFCCTSLKVVIIQGSQFDFNKEDIRKNISFDQIIYYRFNRQCIFTKDKH